MASSSSSSKTVTGTITGFGPTGNQRSAKSARHLKNSPRGPPSVARGMGLDQLHPIAEGVPKLEPVPPRDGDAVQNGDPIRLQASPPLVQVVDFIGDVGLAG